MTQPSIYRSQTAQRERDRQGGLAWGGRSVAALDEIRELYCDVVECEERLRALQRVVAIDNTPPSVWRTLTDGLRTSLDVSAARVHLLDDTQQRVKAGLADELSGTTPVESSACQYAIRQNDILVIGDLTACDELEPVIVGGETMRSYAGAPLVTTDGHAIGVVCLLDARDHREFSNAELELLKIMARVVVSIMEEGTQADTDRHKPPATLDRDPVTGLLGRQELLGRLHQLVDADQAVRRVVGVLAVHVRRMDRITHAHGWAAANQLRWDISERLRAGLGNEEVLGHTDDRTFVVITPVDSDGDGGADHWLNVRARDLLALIRGEAFAVGGDRVQPEVGVGVAIAPRDSEYAPNLMAMADEAAAEAASRYLDRIGNPNYDDIASKRRLLALEGPLRRAVARGDFCVHYQPIVDLSRDGRVVGAEALVRWPQPDGEEPIGPDVFIPLAEELGLMDAIGRYVFETSCRQLRHWQSQPGGSGLWVSVNVSPSQLSDPNLASRFAEIAREERVSPADLKLEITEGVIDERGGTATPVIHELARVGFPLALDDFGTGHSSLARVISLPFQLLKVDRSFVWDSPNGAGAGVVSSLSQLAGYLQLASLGEGVETKEHEAFLCRCGYTYAQGYRYGKPIPAHEFAFGTNNLLAFQHRQGGSPTSDV